MVAPRADNRRRPAPTRGKPFQAQHGRAISPPSEANGCVESRFGVAAPWTHRAGRAEPEHLKVIGTRVDCRDLHVHRWEHAEYFEAARAPTEQRFSHLKTPHVTGLGKLTYGPRRDPMIKLIMAVVASNRAKPSQLRPCQSQKRVHRHPDASARRRPRPRARPHTPTNLKATPHDGPRSTGAVHRHVCSRKKSVE